VPRHEFESRAIFRENVQLELLLRTLVIACVYAITAKLSLVFTTLPGQVTAVWFPSGFAFAFVIWFGRWALPGIALGSIVFMVWNSLTMTLPWSAASDIISIIACSLASSLEPVIGVVIIYWLTHAPPSLDRTKAAISCIVAAVLASMFSALIGITVSSLVGIVPWSNYGISLLMW
jgi:integral membrane sensor domain MASE1